jgi:hypothetical protein
MEPPSEGLIKLDLIKDKQLYNPVTKSEIELQYLWNGLEKNQLVVIIFFRKWE